MATRIAYALILLVNSIISWLMLTDWAMKKLEHLTLDYMHFCTGGDCFGFVAVHRMNFALGIFHAIMATMLLGVRSSKDGRAPIQNGFWGPKILAWVGLIVVSFFIPETFFATWGKNLALIGAILFLFIGLILLVDLAHNWAEFCQEKIETAESRVWTGLLVGTTLSMYLASFAMTIVMYIFFAKSGCQMNQAAITINLLLVFIASIVSIHPVVQNYNTRAGLAQSAMVAVYCTYLTMSAVGMEPDDHQCNPLIRARGTRRASIVVGAIVTFVTVAYTTTRAATYGLALGSQGNSYSQLATEDYEAGPIYTQPESRRELRTAALRAAVESGSLPASALDDDSDDESDDGKNHPRDDERSQTQYNYAMFHIIFLLACCWVSTLLTMNFDETSHDDFVAVGRTYWASWAKIVSSWACYGIYIWSLVAPVVVPDRFDY
ncbi:membrane protein TMS1 [Pseudovirgaria hyperparasitica]|uniref:Membrane protein TMS1 n=1 Tax=Pseudovirgaria hyperparasitica TaxID=470096 RepID=A0A6A6WJD2_9PEZI|nr:membrane protein TMS1 [Pseudovirgaria hyperparasitica]KAF2762335.1 membrane protein TMS1 [Pseudovirgaria hyperparasitica]